MCKILCIDIGGTTIKIAICNEGEILGNILTLDVETNKKKMIKTIIDYIDEKINKSFVAISISIAGILNKETNRLIKCSSFPFLVETELCAIFSKLFHVPVFIENDANCAALAEATYGKYKNVSDIVFIIIGTGVGGAILKNKRIHYGSNGYAGEFGCMYFVIDGKLQKFSHLASTISCVNKVREFYPYEIWDGKKFFDEVDKGNQKCVKIATDFYNYLALGIINIQHIYDPDVFLIGGGISQRKSLKNDIEQNINKILLETSDKTLIKPRVDTVMFDKNANLLGAYANALDGLKK